MAEPKIYVSKCSLKQKTFPSGGHVLSLSVKWDDFVSQCRPHVNEKGYVNFDITSRKEVGKYGDTHCMSFNTWKPSGGQAGRQETAPAPAVDDGALPF